MILSILKIIGLILLIILCVLLVLILLVLFVPLRYAVEFEYDSAHMRLDAKATWLASIIRCYAGLRGRNFFYQVKALFFSIIDSTREPKAKKNNKKKTKTQQAAPEQDTVTQQKTPPQTEPEPQDAAQGQEQAKQQAAPEQEQTADGKAPSASEPPKDEAEKENGRKSRRSFRFPFRIMHPADIYDKIIRTLMDFSRKLDKICAQIVSEENRETVLFVLGQIKELLYHIRPRKHGIYLKLGMKDPSLTGQIMGAYSVLNSVFEMNFILEPYFDREILETKLYFKGHIRIISLIIIAIRLYRNKTIRKLIRRK